MKQRPWQMKFSTQLGNSEVKRTESVGAVIGAEVTKNAVTSLAVAFIALAAYISFRFEYKIAVSAIVSILHDLIMVLGVFSFFRLEIDASSWRLFCTVVGYSMNEAVVIFDRVRENIRTHRRTDTYECLAEDSIAQSIHRSIYTLTTVLLACGSFAFLRRRIDEELFARHVNRLYQRGLFLYLCRYLFMGRLEEPHRQASWLTFRRRRCAGRVRRSLTVKCLPLSGKAFFTCGNERHTVV